MCVLSASSVCCTERTELTCASRVFRRWELKTGPQDSVTSNLLALLTICATDMRLTCRRWEVVNGQVGSVTGNFLSLVRFWQKYYLYRGKDGFSLEVSSSIPYSRWRAIVLLLEKLLDPEEEGKGMDSVSAGVAAIKI